MKKKNITMILITIVTTAFITSVVTVMAMTALLNRVSSEHVEKYASAITILDGYGTYSIVSDEEGLICKGRAYKSKELATEHPIVLQIDEANVWMSNKYTTIKRSIEAGNTYIISTDEIVRKKSYIMVVVKTQQ